VKLLKTVQHISKKYPERDAFVNGEAVLSYGDLWEKSNRLASYIGSLQLEPKSPIMVYGHMDPEMLISFLASVKSGHPYIPVDLSIPADRVSSISERSQSGLMISTVDKVPELQNEGTQLIPSEQLNHILGSSENTIENEDKWVSEEDNFYIIYTSGSTGNPKGVQITANNLQSFVNWMLEDFSIQENRRFLNQAPFSFDLSVMDLYPSLCSGGTLIAATKDLITQPKRLFEELEKANIQVWTSTPSFAQMCLMDPSFNDQMIPGMEVFLFCGEVLSTQTARQLKERFPKAKIFNSYGPTEATVAVTMLEVTDEILEAHHALPIGYIKSDCQLLVVDEEGQPVKDGEKGELIIVGPSVSKGYLGEKTLTEKSFFLHNGQRAYKTGDAGYIKDGLAYYQGRLDFQVKVHGYRMELEEIEFHIRQSQYVEACVVVPVYKDDKVDYLSAFIVPASHSFEKDYQLTSAIKKDLAEHLPAYMIPRKFVYCKNLPMTPNGKVDRKQLVNGVLA
jgi:D-alanine--poly(phosphoribitol) ligase subunit 1